ncbi:hypothetical protein PCANC_05348 [Puccinia coronata f. sp. avenae]|uniref:Uncharacterized protein n=1 Tax=Puccinia coronata f. sp. avenae TaxID=200324 RepID=A0A2N5VX82_9BASI|nr:hypothetical protein PCASD_09385 [Puccinia coronata f. sp. avenae]PLW54604.1 hypothetical protein PCANC_05348 [Puccinia coronata f. sp. avenae]
MSIVNTPNNYPDANFLKPTQLLGHQLSQNSSFPQKHNLDALPVLELCYRDW